MRILMIGPPERKDFYNYLEVDTKNTYLLLWHESKKEYIESEIEIPSFFSEMFFWAQFSTPQSLLKHIKPDRIVFFEIIDLRQIALIITAKSKKIITFYLEHGAAGNRDTAISRWKEQDFKNQKLPYLIKRFKTNFRAIIKSKLFYYSVIKGFDSFNSYLKFIKIPFQMLVHLPNKVLSQNKFRERIPEYSIVFNQANYEQYELYTGISKNEALFTGIPFFDKFYSPEFKEENHIVFIDAPYLEQGLINWDDRHHRYVAEILFSFAERHNLKLFIKLHPTSNKNNWTRYAYNKEFVEILENGEYTNIFLKSKLILGFVSSLINGFLCAQKNVVLLGWHPSPRIVGADFSKFGLCHVSLSPIELESKFDYWVSNNLAKNNETAYQEFLKKFNYPFDGNASERVLRAITSDEIS